MRCAFQDVPCEKCGHNMNCEIPSIVTELQKQFTLLQKPTAPEPTVLPEKPISLSYIKVIEQKLEETSET